MAKTTMQRSPTDAEEQSKRAEANYLISPSKLTYMLEADLLDPLSILLKSRDLGQTCHWIGNSSGDEPK